MGKAYEKKRDYDPGRIGLAGWWIEFADVTKFGRGLVPKLQLGNAASEAPASIYRE